MGNLKFHILGVNSLSETYKKDAIIIGINNYYDDSIPNLEGAENDANEMYERLHSDKLGNFNIRKDHYLINDEASFLNIRKAISDLFYAGKSSDLAVLYFSGHGTLDGYDDGYIAPYDMDSNTPYCLGIDMSELARIVSKSNNKANLIIIDCCYSGAVTKPAKAKSAIQPATGKEMQKIHSHIKKFVDKKTARGTYIFASSQSNKNSREFTPKEETKTLKKQTYGLFTYYLLKGLDGEAAENGVVYYHKLKEYLAEKLPIESGDQLPTFLEAGAENYTRLEIAKVSALFVEYIKKQLDKIQKKHKNNAVSLISSIQEIFEILESDKKNQRALKLQEECNAIFDSKIKKCKIFIASQEEKLYNLGLKDERYAILKNVTMTLKFQKVSGIDQLKKQFICPLFDFLDTDGTPETLDIFIETVNFVDIESMPPEIYINSNTKE